MQLLVYTNNKILNFFFIEFRFPIRLRVTSALLKDVKLKCVLEEGSQFILLTQPLYIIQSQVTNSITLYVTGPEERSELNMQIIALDSDGKPLQVNGKSSFTIQQVPENDQYTDVAITKSGMCGSLSLMLLY